MSDLRSKVIRLAHANPDLRPHLLPILTAGLHDGSKLRPEVVKAIHDIISDVIRDKADAIRALTGRGGSLRPSKPKDLVFAYLWRMARFHSGDDPRMPVMADFDLAQGLQARLQAKGYDEFRRPEEVDQLFARPGKAETLYSTDIPNVEVKRLDPFVDELIKALGKDPMGAARRWQGLI
jgi:hypothetical protein